MPFLSEDDFRQAIKDGEALGIPKATTYQNLKMKGYEIEGDPESQPTPENSGGILGYLGTTAKSALRELESVAKFVGHYASEPGSIAPDALNFGKDTVKVGAQAVVGGAENLYQAITGQKVPQFKPGGSFGNPGDISYPTGGTQEQKVANTLGQNVKYAVTHPAEMFRDHPLQTLSTVAPLASAGFKLAGMTKAASVAKWADPVTWATEGVPAAAKMAKNVGQEAFGKMTGAGAGAIQAASQVDDLNSPFFQGMRGDPLQQASQLADDAQRGFEILKAKRAKEYLKTNEAMRAITEPMDPGVIQRILGKTMKEFRIGDAQKDVLDSLRGMTDDQAVEHLQNMMKQPVAGLVDEVPLSPLVKSGLGEGPTASKISKAIGYIERWDDYTPDGLDRLQKSLSSIDPKPGTPEAAFISKVKKGVQNAVKKQYPEYEKMLAGYREASEQIEELQSAIGNIDRQGIETTVRKMAQSMQTGNQGFQFRNALLEQMEKATGISIRERVAGMALNQVMPRGLAGVGAGIGATAVVGKLISPTFLVGLAMSSPRVVGEVLGNLGVAKSAIAPMTMKIRSILPPGYIMNIAAGVDAFKDSTNE